MRDVFMLIVGKGGMSLNEARWLKNMRIVQLIIDGQTRRDHTHFEAARLISQPWCKEPIHFPWDNDTFGLQKTEEELQAEFEAARPQLEAQLRAYMEQQKSVKAL